MKYSNMCMKTLDKILFWFFVQIGFIALLYNIGLFPSRLVFDNLLWGGQSSINWALSYLSVIPYCLVICLTYTLVGIIVTKHVPIHSKKWWIIASVCYLAFLIISGLYSYMMTGYAFYDTYGFAIIDIWVAPILWLGEVELFLSLAAKWKEEPVVIKLWTGLQKGTKWILISLFLGLIVFTLSSLLMGCTKDPAIKQKDNLREGTVFDGIDVSHHNGKIDWKKVKQEFPDLKFVYIKCTEGATYVDPDYLDNAKGARAQNFNVGAYHYFRMTSSAHDQFHNFKKQLDGIDFNLIPMVDVERDDDKPRKELQDSLRVLLDLLEKEYGVTPMLYGTNSSYNKFCAPEFNLYPKYIGRYGDNAPVMKGSGHYTIWQFSEDGIINGIPKPVDLCRFFPNKGITDIIYECL